MTHYQICTNCVMDTSDPAITFDANGVCDNCNGFYKNILPHWHPDETGRAIFQKLVDKIKSESKNKPYDSILGLSGGPDSSWLLHLVITEFGLRPLVFHVDGGWNTNTAVNNIKKMVDKLGLDLHTEVIDWQEMRDFQLAFFKAGTANVDHPQDHAFVASQYRFTKRHNIKYILNGYNYSTECTRTPTLWQYYGTDMAFINDIRRQFGTSKMETYPWSPILNHKVYLRYIKGVRVVKPLLYLPYVQKNAIDTLSKIYGWEPLPRKHFESRLTKFIEGYWNPTRFGNDIRRVQFSSLIVTGQMTREAALKELESLPYDPNTIDEEFEFIANKLEISVEELKHYHQMPKKFYRDYKNREWFFKLGARVMHWMGQERAMKR